MSTSNNRSNNQSKYLVTEDAAAYLSLSRRTLEAWRLQGRGPTYVKLGRKVVYRPEDLDAFAENGTHAPAEA